MSGTVGEKDSGSIRVDNSGSMKGVVIGGTGNTVHQADGDNVLPAAAVDLRRLARACADLGQDGAGAPDALAAEQAADAAERADLGQVRASLGRLSRWGLAVAQQIGVGLLVEQLIG